MGSSWKSVGGGRCAPREKLSPADRQTRWFSRASIGSIFGIDLMIANAPSNTSKLILAIRSFSRKVKGGSRWGHLTLRQGTGDKTKTSSQPVIQQKADAESTRLPSKPQLASIQDYQGLKFPSGLTDRGYEVYDKNWKTCHEALAKGNMGQRYSKIRFIRIMTSLRLWFYKDGGICRPGKTAWVPCRLWTFKLT